jgi:uncharacterized protein YeaO (DUF488 family)
MIKLKRAYEQPGKDDGERILVERLWPRGLPKLRAKIDLWLRERSELIIMPPQGNLWVNFGSGRAPRV